MAVATWALEAYVPGANGLPPLRQYKLKTKEYIKKFLLVAPVISRLGIIGVSFLFLLFVVCTRPFTWWRYETQTERSEAFASRIPKRLRSISAILRMHALIVWLRQPRIRTHFPLKGLTPRTHGSAQMPDGIHHFGQFATIPVTRFFHAKVAVVGSGPAGMVAAVRFAEAGIDIILVEAGLDKAPGDFASDSAAAMQENMWEELISFGNVQYPVLRGKVTGGTATINSGIIVQLPDDVLEEWCIKYGFPYSDEVRHVLRSIAAELSLEMKVAPVSDAQLGTSEHLVQIGGKELKLHYQMTRNAPTCKSSGTCLEGCNGGHKHTPREVWLARFYKAGGKLLTSATVTKVHHYNGKVTAVTGFLGNIADNVPFSVNATSAIILAAGAVGTPELLLRSQIGNKQCVGKGGRAHPGAAIVGEYPEPMERFGPTQGLATTDLRKSGNVKIETLRVPLHVSGARPMIGGHALMEYMIHWRYKANWVVVNWAKQSEARVSLSWWRKRLRYTFNYHPHDVDNLINGIKLVVKQHFAAGAQKVYPFVVGLPTFLTREDNDRIDDLFDNIKRNQPWRMPYGVLTHLFGGACWGSDPKSSVANWDGKVHGFENLYIMCAAGFPTNIGVNPQLSISMMARWMTSKLIARMQAN